MHPFGHFLNRTIIPRSLFWRSFLIIVLPLVVLQLVLTVIFYNRHWDTVTQSLSRGTAADLAVLSESLADADSEDERNEILERFRRLRSIAIFLEPGGNLSEVLDSLAELDRFSPSTHINRKILEAFAEKLPIEHAIDLNPKTSQTALVYIQLPMGLLRAVVPRDQITSTTTGLLLFWMIGVSIVLLLIAIYFLRLQVHPIRQLAHAVESFGKGQDLGSFQPRGPSEIRHAARAYNSMRERIIRHVAQRTEMLAAISHDLRTPLTRMMLELELLRAESTPDEQDVIEGLAIDVAEMMDLVDTYLTFVRGEEGEKTRPVHLATLFEMIKTRAERLGAEVNVYADDRLNALVRPQSLKRCLANLVDNACRFARHIELTAALSGKQVQICVDDDGPGIPEEMREQVMQPFFRLEDSDHRGTGGSGLGLTIARDIVLSHGGRLFLEESPLGGTRARIILPG